MQHALASSPFRPRCVPSSSTTAQSFFAQWIAQREWESHRWELVNGRMVRRPAVGPVEATIARRLHRQLARAADERGVVVLGLRQGLELPTGDTLTPDIAVLSSVRWAAATPGVGDLLRVVPELVIEVLRDPDARARAETREIYARAGVHEHWVVDPRLRTITVVMRRRDRLELGDVVAATDRLSTPLLPDFALELGLVF